MSTRTEQWSVELVLRYVCATLVTWIAAAGAQLVVRTDFIVVIFILAFVGAPVSLYLRLHAMRVAGIALSRPLWNAFTVLVFFVGAGCWTLASMSDLLQLVINGGSSQSFWLRFGAEGSLQLLMQVFLLFAAFRSFALISDKDATLATVPSFSVLLLLIPVHKGIEVVLYFLMWTLAATTLFALDHRAELQDRADGCIPSATPGQDVSLAARGLATVLGAALVAAFALSALLTSRNADDRSATESAITGLAGRLAQLAMNSSESSLSGGPERQIDFTSGPSLPSRAILWRARVRTADDQAIRPGYFRLFTLGQYNGSTWTQISNRQRKITISPISEKDWPESLRGPFGAGRGNVDRFRFYGGFGPPREGRMFDAQRPGNFNMVPGSGFRAPYWREGFLVKNVWPSTPRAAGRPTLPISVGVESVSTNLGFVPLLPGTRALYLSRGRLEEARAGSDGSIDLNFVMQDQRMRSLSDVPMIAEYGFPGRTAPLRKVTSRPDAPQLSSEDRAIYLNVPSLSARAIHLSANALANSPKDESNYGRARRLAFAIQTGATYTLRPPTPPEGREATDFFLFDGNKRGYCTHFASSLTVLCRAQNIPARVVSGFAAQEYSSEGTAILREANAHAWTEVWVENWGWAPIDATPATDRGDNSPNLFAYWSDWFGFAFNQLEMWSRSRVWVLALGLVVVLMGIYAFRRRRRLIAWWARRRGKLSSDEWTRREIIIAYDYASARLARLFRPREPFETPDEWLVAARQFAQKSPRARQFARPEFELLTQHYLRALYAPEAPEGSAVAVARELARTVRRRKVRN